MATTPNATTAAITSTELHDRLASDTPLWILDVRTPAEFETTHIDGSYNVPLDVLKDHGSEVAEQLDQGHDVVLVCRSGQRAYSAARLLSQEEFDTSVVSGGMLSRAIMAPTEHSMHTVPA